VFPGGLYNEQYYYYVTTSSLTYAEAAASCQSGGGYLATISSATMNTAIVGIFGSSSTFWIGYSRSTLPCGTTWVWQDGSSSSYTNWATYQPDCYLSNENSVEINFGGAGYWNDRPASYTLQGICSVTGTAQPLTSFPLKVYS